MKKLAIDGCEGYVRITGNEEDYRCIRKEVVCSLRRVKRYPNPSMGKVETKMPAQRNFRAKLEGWSAV